jgi:hypothetical protein
MRRRNKGQRGAELIEFALVTSFLLPTLFGTIIVGLNLARGIQVTQLSRDTGHMYARNIDFSDTNNKKIIERLAQGLNITTTGGNGAVILSTVTFIAPSDCAAANLSAGACTNINQCVFKHRIVVGNASVRASAFGTPNPALIDATGAISTLNYLKDSSARAVGFYSVLPLSSGEYAYVSEAYVKSADYGLPGYTSTGVYARTVF